MWGGGDGSSDMQREGVSQGQQSDAPAGAAGAVGASEDEQIYGTQPAQANGHSPESMEDIGGDGELPESSGQGFGQEEVMQDPWTSKNEGSSGFLGGDDSGGGWGDWGGGDWS